MPDSMWLDLLILAVALFAIYKLSDKLVGAINSIAERFKIPQSIAGATLAAVGSSFPEFMTSVFSVGLKTWAETQGGESATSAASYGDVGIGTIIGSAIFNICMIVGISAIFRKLEVSRRVVTRDCVWYLLTTVTAIAFVFDGRVELWEASVWMVMYVFYGITLYRDIKRHPEEAGQEEHEHMSAGKAWGWFFLSVVLMGVCCHFLVERTAHLGHELGVPSALLSLIVVAVGTSVPDTLASVHSARKGLGSMAISNAIGSNVFDILICLGVPMAIYSGVQGTSYALGELEGAYTLLAFGIVCLLVSVILATVFIRTGWVVNKIEGAILILFYFAFVAGAIVLFLLEWQIEPIHL